MKGECDSLTGSHLISGLITVACSNLNEESRVSRVPTLATHGRYVTKKLKVIKMQCVLYHWKELEHTFTVIFIYFFHIEY